MIVKGGTYGIRRSTTTMHYVRPHDQVFQSFLSSGVELNGK